MTPSPVGCESAGRTRPPITGGMWRAWIGQQSEPAALREQAVEWALMLADDTDCLDDVAAVLRGVLRPDLTVTQVVDRLEGLMWMAGEASRQELYGRGRALDLAAEEYQLALTQFANGGQR